ncbi:hypothetical protein CHS0354_018524 [Potamilus streckersoni]|uniref:Histidine kinase/HSP90-like ATPase domain-containing protein n=1 Tax=Potamilus streckersoni TaxID=2493646 RepID=A0AAE0W9D7_9BIVA|nr:hypothetical protein CHS0354_018524 [Potamilus streckersoni]
MTPAGYSPARRTWKRFTHSKRGYFSFLLVCLLFIVSAFSEIWINSRALMVVYNEGYFFPVVAGFYPDTTFGGTDNSEANYRQLKQRLAETQTGYVIMPFIPYNPYENDLDVSKPPPPGPPDWNARHLLGTDKSGRDIFARLIYGFRTAIWFSLLLYIFVTAVGVLAGALMGYFVLMQRFVEIWSMMPDLYIIMIIASVLIPGFWLLLLIMIIFGWTGMTWQIRAEVYREKNREYAAVARVMGVSHTRIILFHLLPNSLVPPTRSHRPKIPSLMNASDTPLSILVLADNTDTGTHLLSQLTEYRPIIAETLQMAVNKLKRTHFDIAVISAHIDGIPATDILKLLSETYPMTAVIAAYDKLTTEEVLAIAEYRPSALLKLPADNHQIKIILEKAQRSCVPVFEKMNCVRMENRFNVYIEGTETAVQSFTEAFDRLAGFFYPRTTALRELKTALYELLSNAAVHGCRRPDSLIYIRMSFVRDAVQITIRDAGNGFDAKSELEKQNALHPDRHSVPAVYGLKMASRFSDELIFSQKGNTVSLLRFIPNQQTDSRQI